MSRCKTYRSRSVRLVLEALEDRTVPSLVAAYGFEENAGAVTADVTGKGHTGYISGASWNLGKFGQGLFFDGINDYMTVNDAPDLGLTNGMTLEAWVYPTWIGPNEWREILIKERPGGECYNLYANMDSNQPGVFIDPTSGPAQDARGIYKIPSDAWTHLAATFDGSTLSMYVNGTLTQSRAVTGSMITGAGSLNFGYNTIWGGYFAGVIDEVRIYDTALDEAAIAQDMDTPVVAPPESIPPTITAITPKQGASGQSTGIQPTVQFSEDMDPASINSSSIELHDPSGAVVSATVSYDAATFTAAIHPTGSLVASNGYYRVVVKGGAGGVKDLVGNAPVNDFTSSFSTGLPAFSDSVVLSGLTEPTAVRFAPDGRVFVAEKSGLIKVFDSINDPTPDIFADLRTNVHNFMDRGLVSMALDPNFATNPYVYVLYTFDGPIGGTAPLYGTPGQDADPAPNAFTTGAPASARLSRLRANGNFMTGPEQVLVSDWATQFPGHSVGSIAFGADGALYVSAGDGAKADGVDYGQNGNPFNDPANEGGALRSQDLLSPNDPASLDGAVIRIDPNTGLGLPWNVTLTVVGSPTTDANGVEYYTILSPYLGNQTTTLRILRPTNPAPGKPLRFLYILPVGPGVTDLNSEFGDGLEQARIRNLQNAYNAILIAPSFNIVPWYADHATNSSRRLESFLVKDLVPFVDRMAPAGTTPERWAVGFSKSGNGVLTLILHNPNVFSAVACWDAPAEISNINQFNMVDNFGTEANFDNNYYLPTLIARAADPFKTRNRLWISGDNSAWTADMLAFDQQLTNAGMLHTFVGGVNRVHHWASGWLDLAIADLDAQSTAVPRHDENARRIVAFGLRDPSRIAIRPGTNEIWAGDIGWNFEEIDRIANPVDGVIDNFGWPGYEGNSVQPDYAAANLALLQQLYGAQGAATGPYFTYGHNNEIVSGAGDGGGGSISGLAFANGGSAMPGAFDGALFFADSARNRIYVMFRGVDGLPDPTNIAVLVTGTHNPAELIVGPDGSLYYPDLVSGTVRRVQFDPNVTNHAPVATIDTPLSSTQWQVGNSISFTGHAADTEDGALSASALTWTVTVHQGANIIATQTYSGVSGGTFLVPDVAYPAYIEVKLTATDSQGLSSTQSVQILPQTAALDLQSNRPGLQLSLDGAPAVGPIHQTVIVGSSHTIAAPSTQTVAGVTYQFVAWSDSGAAGHAISASAGSNTYTATFDAAPSDITPGSLSVSESAANGDTVGTLAVSDLDLPNDSFTFAILNQEHAGTFAIDPATGVITVADHTQLDGLADPSHSVTVQVTDAAGAAFAKTINIAIQHPNQAPTATIDTPNPGDLWQVGQLISFSGHGTDAEDGALTGTSLSWTVRVYQGANLFSTQSFSGAAGSFTVPNVAYPAFLELQLTATDSQGASRTQTMQLQPQTTSLTVQANVAGLQLSLDGSTAAAPLTTTVIVGSAHTIAAAAQNLGAVTYQLVSWSDGGAATHSVTAATSPATYIATFDAVPSDITPASFSVAENAANGAVVGAVSVTDADLPNDSFTFTLVGQEHPGAFAIDSATGQITVADGTKLDFESDASHVLTVQATDSAGYSVTKAITVSLTDQNDAPTLLTYANLPSIPETATNDLGVLVSSLFTSTDADANAVAGIALIGSTEVNGAWQYSTDGGGSWNSVGTVSAGSALLLDGANRIRFLPSGHNGGTSSLLFRVWDEISGAVGSRVSIGATGGSSAFSSSAASSNIVVTFVPPTVTISPPTGGVRGQSRTFSLTANDPGSQNPNASFTYTINWGDGSGVQTVSGPGSLQLAHIFNTTATFSISVTVTDEDGGNSAPANLSYTTKTIEMQGDTLAVGGTTGNDTFSFTLGATAGTVSVVLNGSSLGTFTTNKVLAYGNTGSDSLTVAGTAGADNMAVVGAAVTANGIAFNAASPMAWSLSGGNGVDTLTGDNIANTWTLTSVSGGTLNNIAISNFENFAGGAGTDTLVGRNVAATWSITGNGAGSVSGFNFTGMENLSGGTAVDTFSFAGGSVPGNIAGGADNDILTYANFGSPATVNLQTGTATSVGGQFSSIEQVVGSSSSDTLIGPDSGAAWTISGANAGSAAGVAFSAIENLTGGAGADTFTMSSTGSSLSGTLDGGAGVDTLVARNTANTWNINATGNNALTGLGRGFIGMENLTGSASADTFVFATGAAVAGNINGAGGTDVLNYSSYGGPVTVNLQSQTATGIGGAFSSIETITGSPQTDTLIGPNAVTTWSITASNAGSVAGIKFTSFENATGGSGDDTFRFSAGASGARLTGTVDGGTGNNQLDYTAYTAAVTVNLQTGAATAIGWAVNIRIVSGGSGNDVLTGNAADNVLIGNGGADTLDGGDGNDILLGGGGNDFLRGGGGRDLLVGGSGADQIGVDASDDGAGDDILIGGTVSYYNETARTINLAALDAIMAEWARTDLDYDARRLNLSNGGGLNGANVLNSTTIANDSNAMDRLYGKAGLDWFLYSTNDVVGDFGTGGAEVKTQI